MRLLLMIVFAIGLTASLDAFADPCRKTVQCKESGKCTLAFGLNNKGERDEDWGKSSCQHLRCIATSAKLCRKSENCRHLGYCILDKTEDSCVVRKDSDCRRSTTCKIRGNCTFAGRTCKAKKASDCRKSVYCKNHGLCTLNEREYLTRFT